MAVELLLLGDVRARVDGRPVDLGHARQQCVLVALLVDANRVVPADRLLDRVWGDQRPQRARNALSGYVSRLRALLGRNGDVTITRRSDGYLLTVDPDAVDLHRFHRLLARARSTTRGGDTGDEAYPGGAENPAVLLERALTLWRDEPFGTLDTAWLAGIRTALAAERLAAVLDLVDLALAGGRQAELLGELAARAAEHPFDERIAGQLMTALYRCGRQADALRHYQDVRSRLAEELGMDPAAALQRLYHRILTNDPALEVTAAPGPERVPAEPATAATATPPSAPRQLPAPPSAFSGREYELTELDALLEPAPETAGTAVVSGSAGVGKSALAVYWAHRTAERFPDGQLYVNLRGFDPDGVVVDPAEAVRGFLDAFGVPAQRVPVGVAAQTALYRSLVAGRRVLVVLDNARDAAQVRPLLPGAPGCATVVTSRNQLGGLVAIDGARAVTLDLFTVAEARRFLARRLGADRVVDQPAAVDELVTRCARLPLALAVVAARAAAHRDFRLADLAAELRTAGGSLDPFDGGEPAADVRAVFSWSYRALSPNAARLFRLVGLHPGPDLGTPAVAAMAGLPPTAVRRPLTELARAHLLTERSPGRYVLHDLLRAYAAEQAAVEEAAPDRRAAANRLLDHYLHTAYAADRLLYPHRDPIVLVEPVPGAGPAPPGDRAEAMTWLGGEHQVLHALVDWAARTGFDRHTWELAWSLTSFFNLRGYWHDQVAVQRTALDAARRIGDEAAQAHVHRNLGRAHTQLGQLDQARAQLALASELFVAVGDRANQAQTRVNIARILEQQGRDMEALHHDQRSLDLYRDAGHLTGQARALNNIACMLTRLGDHDQARDLCRQALRLNEEIGNRHGAATNWQSLGYLEYAAGAYRDATTACRRALDLFGDVGDRAGEAETLTCLGEALQARGAVRAAHETWQRALTLLDEMGHPDADRVRRYLFDQRQPAVQHARPWVR
ncbi:AfsR/SARP family transcriptional regulator [Plantactinospora soyae]|uniref:DNA-binding SARP family transcriptional activator/tetratricopeptide (TPR) repeat protein n=1 Tax=Plantactinospora soyae TaxID=1544732 RepID=A0A927QUC3_9ACTN|nr:BTAD domain-containing putative transcriptional regulator [Plantactinospora soyae]MBE1484395.1 DNA-binding SARP family transcriptional activator/tetratricopeptide (TPR) repeat protein [Plantactinospora soyae]